MRSSSLGRQANFAPRAKSTFWPYELGHAWERAGVRDLVNRDLGALRDELQEPRGELMQVRLCEVAVEGVTVLPLLDRDEALLILHRGEEAVAEAAILAARVVLHSLQ